MVGAGSLDLNFSNRPVRTGTPGRVAGAQPAMCALYADSAVDLQRFACDDLGRAGSQQLGQAWLRACTAQIKSTPG